MKEHKQKVISEWILKNMKIWYIICGLEEEKISKDQYHNIYKKLEKEGFHELQLVLFTCQNDVATTVIERSENNSLTQFIAENMDLWLTICGLGEYPISSDVYKKINQILDRENFEELKFVLFSCHGYAVHDQFLKVVEDVSELCKKEIDKRKK